MMLTALVRSALAGRTTVAEMRERFLRGASDLRRPEGLVRTYLLVGEDGLAAGAIQLWRSREMADAYYASGFRVALAGVFGGSPSISYFHTPVIVDNLTGEIEDYPPVVLA